MKEDYIDRLLVDVGRQGALRRDGRLAAHAADRRRYYRLAVAALAALLVAVGGVNVALAARQEQSLRCNSACNAQELLTAADGVIASCRQNTTI